MEIKEFLFGKEIVFSDKIIGELKARIKNRNPSINYTWTGEHQFSKQKKKTVFILEGNVNGPYKEQLKSVHRIIEDLDNITNNVNAEIRINKRPNERFNNNWIKEFYLAAITPIEIRENNFEVTFEPINDEDISYVSFTWTKDRITEIELK